MVGDLAPRIHVVAAQHGARFEALVRRDQGERDLGFARRLHQRALTPAGAREISPSTRRSRIHESTVVAS